MKSLTLAQKMRRVAGILYLVLCVYQMLLFNVLITNSPPSNTPFAWMVQVLLVPGAAALGVWMLAGDTVLKSSVRRAVPAASGALVVFQLLSYNALTIAIQYTLNYYGFLQPLQGSPTWQYLLLVAQLLLLILAAFFVTGCRDALDYAEAKPGKSAAAKEDGKTLAPAQAPAPPSADLDRPLDVPAARKKKDGEKAEEERADAEE